MTRRLVIGLAGVALVVALAAGAWSVAYAQGQTAGRAEVAAARADFLQGLGQGGGAWAPVAGAGRRRPGRAAGRAGRAARRAGAGGRDDRQGERDDAHGRHRGAAASP